MQILGLIVVGLIIGALARLIKPGRQRLSILMTLVLGVVGALIGGVVASLLGERGPGTPTPFSRLAPGDSVEL